MPSASCPRGRGCRSEEPTAAARPDRQPTGGFSASTGRPMPGASQTLTPTGRVVQHRRMTISAGVDLGGTKVQGVVVDEQGKRLGEARGKTPTAGGAEAVVAEIPQGVTAPPQDPRVRPAPPGRGRLRP